MNQHTPVPWRVRDHNQSDDLGQAPIYILETNTNKHICSMFGVMDYTIRLNDARLIAAAPDLLAACERILPWAESAIVSGLIDTNFTAQEVKDHIRENLVLVQLRAAIATAKGQVQP